MGLVRVLHVVSYMGLGGLETMLMNYYRCIDREKVQFDFLVHRKDTAYYDQEIEKMGGKISVNSMLKSGSKDVYVNTFEVILPAANIEKQARKKCSQ